MKSVLGEHSGVPRSIELSVGLDVGSSKLCVAKDGDYHATNGLKAPTMNVGEVDAHTAPVLINLESGSKGTLVPTAEKDMLGSAPGKDEYKTGPYGLRMS